MSYYEILGVPRTSTDKEIKSVYRRLVKKFHPDKNPSEEARRIISQINEAYDVLSDPIKRATYDQRGNFVYTEIVYEEDPRETYRREYIRRKAEEAHIKAGKEEIEWEISQRRAKKAYYFFYLAAFPILTFATLIITDFYLPSTTYEEVAEQGWQEKKIGVKFGYQDNHDKFFTYMKTRNFEFYIDPRLHLSYDYYAKPPLFIETTPIFYTVKTVSIKIRNEHRASYPARNTIYVLNIFLPFLLFLGSLLTVLRREYTDMRLVHCLFLWVFLGIIIRLMI